MYNLPSNNVKVFPFGSPRDNDPLSRVLNEQNLTNIVKHLTDKHSYVVDYNKPDIKFVIEGYYFEVQLDRSTGPLYAGIELATPADETTDYKCLVGGDDTDGSVKLFTGVSLSENLEELEGKFTLQLLDSVGNVPQESWIRHLPRSFSASSDDDYDLTVLYCGNAKELVDVPEK